MMKPSQGCSSSSSWTRRGCCSSSNKDTRLHRLLHRKAEGMHTNLEVVPSTARTSGAKITMTIKALCMKHSMSLLIHMLMHASYSSKVFKRAKTATPLLTYTPTIALRPLLKKIQISHLQGECTNSKLWESGTSSKTRLGVPGDQIEPGMNRKRRTLDWPGSWLRAVKVSGISSFDKIQTLVKFLTTPRHPSFRILTWEAARPVAPDCQACPILIRGLRERLRNTLNPLVIPWSVIFLLET
mmetsp:Transcript_37821/g.58580  ORF Transcript_37821/g.58580 Transcript_37821/m.58580 type:complete len:241 (+) Transcript_37821:323-1045(+)